VGKFLECAGENLFPGIREELLEYFAAEEIKWHDGQHDKPSNHLCDSQVCCANYLMPFAHKPEALADLLRPHYLNLKRMLPVECGQYVAFEWIGRQNYLQERVPHGQRRTRGAHYTSADAMVRFERGNGSMQAVLIEWKFTESYQSQNLHYAESGTDRTAVYGWLWEQPDCPLDTEKVPCFADLFYEPFYQLMRQQLLAHEMERYQEDGAQVVSLLHIAPAANRDFLSITSPGLEHLGRSATGVWTELVRQPERFMSLSTEALFGGLVRCPPTGLEEWATYIRARYVSVAAGVDSSYLYEP
jgi:hypothetical protein